MADSVKDRFLRYVKIDTRSKADMPDEVFPSTEKQKNLAKLLVAELLAIGVSDARTDEFGYVYAGIPANGAAGAPVIGMIAHLDTAPEVSGENVKPRIIENYDGGDIVLNEALGIVLKSDELFRVKECAGTDLIVTDGTTLLGADDKAGIAEIMTMAAYFIDNPEVRHGEIKLAFTPDEEVGRGVAHFDLEHFGADFAYTVDAGALGQYSYENFNAANADVTIRGRSIHTGAAKNQLRNAIHIAMEFDGMLPTVERPAHTEKYEGFVHLSDFTGTTETARLKYHVRDHDAALFARKKDRFTKIAAYLNEKYGDETAEVTFLHRYSNMADKVRPSIHIVDAIKQAMEAAGVIPNQIPTRGGTDGVSLSFMGLPCPNICSGVYHGHSRYECLPVGSLEKITEILIGIITSFAGE